MLSRIAHYIRRYLFRLKKMKPAKAYDLWSTDYDNQAGNVVTALDAKLFRRFIDSISIAGKTILDVGCGTGRHWQYLLDKKPVQLIGYDVSKGMLHQLQQKFRGAQTHVLESHQLYATGDKSCDIIVSTLAIGHMPDLPAVFREWDRVLRPGAEIVITDFHPLTLAKGGKRTFNLNKDQIEITTYVYSIKQVIKMAERQQWRVQSLHELSIDDSIRDHFERNNSLDIFDRNKGLLIVYGIHLKKADAAV